MISGIVNDLLQPVIRIDLRNASGHEEAVEIVVDTGFNGTLTLPSAAIADLGLPWRSRGSALLADGREVEFDIYAAVVIWNGSPRNVLVEAADMEAIGGMRLIHGSDLRIETVEGGKVTIEPLSRD